MTGTLLALVTAEAAAVLNVQPKVMHLAMYSSRRTQGAKVEAIVATMAAAGEV
jgi:hypothetical protein